MYILFDFLMIFYFITTIPHNKLKLRLAEMIRSAFRIVKFPYIFSNILEFPDYGIYISQLIRYTRPALRMVIL